MSTGLECEFIEPQSGEWYYLLEDGSSPKAAFDWREYASAFGPFSSFESAEKHLRDNHANPGGYVVVEHTEFRMDDVYEGLINSADEPDMHDRSFGVFPLR